MDGPMHGPACEVHKGSRSNCASATVQGYCTCFCGSSSPWGLDVARTSRAEGRHNHTGWAGVSHTEDAGVFFSTSDERADEVGEPVGYIGCSSDLDSRRLDMK